MADTMGGRGRALGGGGGGGARKGSSGISMERMYGDLDDWKGGGRWREDEWRIEKERQEPSRWREWSPPSRRRRGEDDEDFVQGKGDVKEEEEVNRLAERIERMAWQHKGEMQKEKSANESLAAFASSLTRKIAELQSSLKDAENKSSTHILELEKQKSTISRLSQESQDLREILEKKNSYIDKMDRDVEEARGQARKLGEDVRILQEENNLLKRKISSSRQDYKSRTEELVKANLELESMTEACESSWSEAKVLRRNLENIVITSRQEKTEDLSALSEVELCDIILRQVIASYDRERQLESQLEQTRSLKDVMQHELYMAKEALAEFQGELRLQSEIGKEKMENEARTQNLIKDLSSKLKDSREEVLKERCEKEEVLRKHHVLLNELSYAETDITRSLSPQPCESFPQSIKHLADEKSKAWRRVGSPNSDTCNKVFNNAELNMGWRVSAPGFASNKEDFSWTCQNHAMVGQGENAQATAINDKYKTWQHDIGRQLSDIRMRLMSSRTLSQSIAKLLTFLLPPPSIIRTPSSPTTFIVANITSAF
eukprot:767272-Hanusia_phi.AAC.5